MFRLALSVIGALGGFALVWAAAGLGLGEPAAMAAVR
jgi:hypothetical protein